MISRYQPKPLTYVGGFVAVGTEEHQGQGLMVADDVSTLGHLRIDVPGLVKLHPAHLAG